MTRVLVTGATDGIGKETVRQLRAASGVDVLAHGRSAKKGANVAADLADPDQVRALAESLRDAHIDVLINNAGVYTRERKETSDGRELTMAVNHDAHVLLTHLLLPQLSRVINVSSIAHERGRIALDDIDMKR